MRLDPVTFSTVLRCEESIAGVTFPEGGASGRGFRVGLQGGASDESETRLRGGRKVWGFFWNRCFCTLQPFNSSPTWYGVYGTRPYMGVRQTEIKAVNNLINKPNKIKAVLTLTDIYKRRRLATPGFPLRYRTSSRRHGYGAFTLCSAL